MPSDQCTLLSLTLQSDNADIVSSIESTLKSAKALQSLVEKDANDWPKVKLLKQSVYLYGQQEYQGVSTPNFDPIIDHCKMHVLADLERLQEKIKEGLS